MSTTTRNGGTRVATPRAPTYAAKGPSFARPDPVKPATITAGELLARARANDLNSRAEKAAVTQLTTGGTNTLLKLVYGTVRVGGSIFCIGIRDDGHLIVGVAWCHGEVNGIYPIWVNDSLSLDGITTTTYLGTAVQTVDATLQTLYPSYTSALPGVCYTVFNIRPRKLQGFPRFAALVEGKLISTSSGGTKVFSQNPAYILADFIENTTYGMGSTVDWTSVAAVAAKCAETVGGSEARNILNLAISNSSLGSEWLRTLADYARCFVIPEGTGYKLIPDTTGSSVKSFNTGNIVADSLTLTRRKTAQQPNMIRVAYTDTSVVPWREAYYPTATVSPRRVSEISIPGITRYSEAVRYATERLNESNLCDLYCSFDTFDEALALVVGDLFDVTHPLGLAAKVFRLTAISQTAPGRWHIEGSEYDPAVYSNSVATAPTTPDTSSLGPLDLCPNVESFAWEEVVSEQADGSWQSTMLVTWAEPIGYPFLAGYRMEWWHRRTSTWKLIGEFVLDASATTWTSPPMMLPSGVAGNDYQANIRPFSVAGVDGFGNQTEVTQAIGRVGTAPPAVASLTADVTTPGTAVLTWPGSESIDTRGYEIRTGGTGWADATPVALVAAPATRAEITGLAAGSTTFRIKTLDATRTEEYLVGQEATTAVSATATVKSINEVDTIAGHLTFTGSAVRIKADFSNGTIGTRAAFQTSTTNSATSIGAIPNGTGTASAFNAFAASDPANSAYLQFKVDSSISAAIINSAKLGTGTTLAMGFYIDSTLYMELNTTGQWRWKFSSKSGLPTTSDIASGYAGVWKDTSGGGVYLAVNDGGTIKKVALT